METSYIEDYERNKRKTSWYNGTKELSKDSLKSLIHLPFPIILFAIYCFVLAKKHTDFSNFLFNHILMYVTVASLPILHLTVDTELYDFIKTSWIIYLLYLPSLLLLSQSSIQFIHLISRIVNVLWGWLISVFVFLILTVCKLLKLSDVLVLSIHGKDIILDFTDICLNFFTIFLVFASVFKLRFGKKVNYGDLIRVIIHSTVFMLFFTIFQLLTIVKRVVFNYNYGYSADVDFMINNIYYFPFLWIISALIFCSEKVQSYIQKLHEKTESQTFQMAQVPVGGRNNWEITTSSYLTVTDIILDVIPSV